MTELVGKPLCRGRRQGVSGACREFGIRSRAFPSNVIALGDQLRSTTRLCTTRSVVYFGHLARRTASTCQVLERRIQDECAIASRRSLLLEGVEPQEESPHGAPEHAATHL
jgi:hypothetical protein